ncbi:PP2C family protein-serine/threonine phosphatase [Sporosarcina limicola]|uniref:Sigma-B regulation protein RsbU (Phosphoserine phosphatase) n=1 Tax=Sporosarcina limicola TaxID=34101 RepID=A0A927ML87_9BACL|nr:PP2C family protein-serine/threonine phosphatase [Sporosarcina limicola]MBE1555202.1 sigma-B regulation protein RsbU (phosphoserine phosphatase) [Sporosarcina limicola]
MPQEVGKQYKELLQQYIDNRNEEDLYFGQQFSRQFIEKKIAPEDVISIHKTALAEVFPDLPEKVMYSFDFLIEMMIHYGLALREHQSLIRKQEEIQMEINVAAKVQDTLLKTKIPDFEGIDIGFITEPAKKMNGDYVYFLNDDNNVASVALADVMGKGIPAALCMSMIKFGMDSLQGENTSPRNVLDIVNRIVEKSVDDSMFISMFYGKYDARDSSFSYASAGHEPALIYRASEGGFTELDAKGLLLGVQPDVDYEERSVMLEVGDFIVMMTDGVTEVRTETGFIDEGLIKSILLEVKEESAQSIADTVYNRLLELQNFHLRDDFTIIIFKKENDLV